MHHDFIQNVSGSKYTQNLNVFEQGKFFTDPNMNEYKNISMKLFRNLLLLAERNYKGENFFKYCDILYIWIYYEIKKRGLTNSIIEASFKELVKYITENLKKLSCPYFSFHEKIQKPEKLIKLRLFQYNTSTFQNILNDIHEPSNCWCLEYVYECINIYKDMNKEFCATKEKMITYKDTCNILENFNTIYSNYFREENKVIYELPLLTDTTTATHTPTFTHVTRCSSNKEKSEPYSSAVDQSSSPKHTSISTAVGTMAGIPPFLVLIYKVIIIYS
ncbi:hypothetical protein PCYB_003600 [Plasmodium cynomolgi strain B]|uniref:CYIR protein n=1 Tax=Plasmodium cynomolgi (strain B) TaxID=1120755 RepID=K6UF75_PLACD|nr:hypothetical protein PCYB_003600 [Plasmodium cynomolgi strain B]GAB69611.1 hypothetical protein PCYB_003600 [Plasmodium cynomolgi strain B]